MRLLRSRCWFDTVKCKSTIWLSCTGRRRMVCESFTNISSCGCSNIEDSRLAMLGDEFHVYYAAAWGGAIESTLPLKGAELDLLIVMKRTSDPARQCHATVWFGWEPTPRI